VSPPPADAERPIGVFDSGVGGLTVLRALRDALPSEQFIYLGDTARLPYGTKSPQTVARYALQAADALVARAVKALVIACNTASSVALPAMRARFGDLPLIGVVEPGAQAAVEASRSGHIAVIGTEATVRGGAYQRAITQRRPQSQVQARACQLFVALAEEGWTSGPVVQAVAEQYLWPLFGAGAAASAGPGMAAGAGMAPGTADTAVPDTLVLACTHFPVLRAVIQQVVGARVSVVDAAATTALATRALLHERGLLREATVRSHGSPPPRYLATDAVSRFAAIGDRFLGSRIGAGEIELIDL
jgi:glutamate racemase